jgi:ribosomal protein S18 acetylase RimI-like enzyme
MPGGFRVRTVDPRTDLSIAASIIETADRFDVGFADNEETWLLDDWRDSAFRGAWIVETEPGEPVAYANLAATDPSATIDSFAAIVPEHRGALRGPLVQHLEQEARRFAVGTATLIVATSSTDPAGALFESLGFTFSRAFWHMERPIDAAFRASPPPAGVTIRPYVSPDDDRLGWELLEETFSGHYAIDPKTFEDYRADVLDHDRWDPTLSSFAMLDEEPAGIVVGEIIDGVGWVDDVGVRERFRGRGIGKALLEHAFELLAGRAVDRIQLNVDSRNATGATRLYERAGMHVRRSFDCYDKRLG